MDRQQQIAENNLNEQQLHEVNEALKRMEKGTYGICVDTGKEIPLERLKAVPYAKRTVEAEEDHQNQTNANGDEDTTRLLKPKREMEDSRKRTLVRIEYP
ncbi:TraR/DksA family transcriptional regulator [Virgibacillus doumboii]|uniref:TraR/DksA family transcriptional regulator n=1 Tax=Virgibacillus doumboii TaxID=2697503 RepID=UPI0013DEB90B|nr:TraR/DksA C4-type zinc finger protein [Virgibacillus doumboii]